MLEGIGVALCVLMMCGMTVFFVGASLIDVYRELAVKVILVGLAMAVPFIVMLWATELYWEGGADDESCDDEDAEEHR